MAKFFVGQRVMIKFSQTFPELNGGQARIISCGPFPPPLPGYSFGDFIVAPDGWGSQYCPYEPAVFSPCAAQLEPITPEGQAPAQSTFHELMDRLRSGVVA